MSPPPPPPPPPLEEIDQYNLLPQPQPTKAIGILNKISGHLANLAPDSKTDDIPVEMKINIDTIPITEAIQEGFFGGHLHNAYELREGMKSPNEIYLNKINSYLIKKDFPLNDATETEVRINLNQNNEKSRNELKRDIIKKMEERAAVVNESNKKKNKKAAEEYARKNPTKTIEKRDGFRVEKPRDFSNFYDETYNFSL